MKILKMIFFASLFIGNVVALKAQDKPVIWLHGYNNNSGFWGASGKHGVTSQSQRRLFSLYPSYTSITIGGITPISQSVATDQIPQYGDQACIIGHSMGGLVAREIERLYGNTRFGGIVSVGTPHTGVPMVSNIRNGNAGRFVSKLLREVYEPIAAAFGYIPGTIASYFFYLFGSGISNIGIQGAYITPSTLNMEPGSAFLNQLNSHNNFTSIPRIGISGSEYDSYLFTRLVAGTFGDNENTDINLNINLGMYYYGMSNAYYYAFFYYYNLFLYTWDPNDFWTAQYCWYVCYKFAFGANYILNGVHRDWKSLIGGEFGGFNSQPTTDGLVPVSRQRYPNVGANDNLTSLGASHNEQNSHPSVLTNLNSRVFTNSNPIFNRPSR
jgi:hypothetical protein